MEVVYHKVILRQNIGFVKPQNKVTAMPKSNLRS